RRATRQRGEHGGRVSENEFPKPLSEQLQPAWNHFVDFLAPHRPRLHRYCIGLVGNVWDGEDLVQDTVVRVFALLGKRWAAIENPGGYLVRVATNLWIDQTRRRALERALLAAAAHGTPAAAAGIPRDEAREAA